MSGLPPVKFTKNDWLPAHTCHQQTIDETRYQKVYQDGVATSSKPGKAIPVPAPFYRRRPARLASRPGNQPALDAE
jgi:hypothetical protein